jgi:hypothetical protein
MQFRKVKWVSISLVIALVFSACSVSPPDLSGDGSGISSIRRFIRQSLRMVRRSCSSEDEEAISDLEDKVHKCSFNEKEKVSEATYLDCLSGPLSDYKKIQTPSCQEKYKSSVRESFRSTVLHRIKSLDLHGNGVVAVSGVVPDTIQTELEQLFEFVQTWITHLRFLYQGTDKSLRLSPSDFGKLLSEDLNKMADHLWVQVFRRGRSAKLEAADTKFSQGLGALNEILEVGLTKREFDPSKKGKKKPNLDPAVKVLLAGQVLSHVLKRIEFFADIHDLICDIRKCGPGSNDVSDLGEVVESLSHLDDPTERIKDPRHSKTSGTQHEGTTIPPELRRFISIVNAPDWQAEAFQKIIRDTYRYVEGESAPTQPGRYSDIARVVPEYATQFVGSVVKLASMASAHRNRGKFAASDRLDQLDISFKEETLANVKRQASIQLSKLGGMISASSQGRSNAASVWNAAERIAAERQQLTAEVKIKSKQLGHLTVDLLERQDRVRSASFRYSDYLAQIETFFGSKKWREHYQNVMLGEAKKHATVSGSDAKYKVNEKVEKLDGIAVKNSLGPLAVNKGDLVTFSVSGRWKPNCALERTEFKKGREAFIGPEGYTVVHSNSNATGSGTHLSYSDRYAVSLEQGASTSLAITAQAGSPLQGLIGIGLSLAATSETHQRESTSFGKSKDDVHSETTSNEMRNSASFEEGIRLPSTPFPNFPAGALLLVQVPVGKNRLSDLIDIQVVRPFTKKIVYQDSELHFVVNDCQGSDTSALVIEILQERPLEIEAKTLTKAMISATTLIEEKAVDYLKRGDISPLEMEALRAEVITKLVTQGLDNNQVELLNKIFLGSVTTELVQLENRVRIVQLEKNIILGEMEAQKLRDSLTLLKGREELSELEQIWATDNLDITGLGEELIRVGEFLRTQLIPVLKVRFPGALASVSENNHLRALATASLDSNVTNLAKEMSPFLAELDAKFELDVNKNQPNDLYVMLSFPRTVWNDDPKLTYDEIISNTEAPYVSPLLALQPWDALVRALPAAGRKSREELELPYTGLFQVNPVDLYVGTAMGKVFANSNGLPLNAVAPTVTGMGIYFEVNPQGNSELLKELNRNPFTTAAEIISENQFPMEHASERIALVPDLARFEIPIFFGSGNSPRTWVPEELLKSRTQRKGLSPFATYAINFGNRLMERKDVKSIAKDIKEIVLLFTLTYRNSSARGGIPWLIANRESSIYKKSLAPEGSSVSEPVEKGDAISSLHLLATHPPHIQPLSSADALREDRWINKMKNSAEPIDRRIQALLSLVDMKSTRAATAFQESNLKELRQDLKGAVARLDPEDQILLQTLIGEPKVTETPEQAKLSKIRKKIGDSVREHMANSESSHHGAFSDHDSLYPVEARTHYFNMMVDLPAQGGGYYHHSTFKLADFSEGGIAVRKLVKVVKKQFESGKRSFAVIIGDDAQKQFATLAIDSSGRVAFVTSLGDGITLNRTHGKALIDGLNEADIHFGNSLTDPIIDFNGRVENISANQQLDEHNSLVFAVLNSHQIAKEGTVDGYKSVTTSLGLHEIENYDDIFKKIGSHGHEGQAHPHVHDEGMKEFIKSFKTKTQELIHEYFSGHPGKEPGP